MQLTCCTGRLGYGLSNGLCIPSPGPDSTTPTPRRSSERGRQGGVRGGLNVSHGLPRLATWQPHEPGALNIWPFDGGTCVDPAANHQTYHQEYVLPWVTQAARIAHSQPALVLHLGFRRLWTASGELPENVYQSHQRGHSLGGCLGPPPGGPLGYEHKVDLLPQQCRPYAFARGALDIDPPHGRRDNATISLAQSNLAWAQPIVAVIVHLRSLLDPMVAAAARDRSRRRGRDIFAGRRCGWSIACFLLPSGHMWGSKRRLGKATVWTCGRIDCIRRTRGYLQRIIAHEFGPLRTTGMRDDDA